MEKTTRFGIGLGSNQGDCLSHLQNAVCLLLEAVPSARLLAAASLYETDPVDCAPGTSPFLNTVIELEAAQAPEALHQHLANVEQKLGRPAVREKNAPRSVDLDLLYAGSLTVNTPTLQVPHPRWHLRRFVLEPLAEIRPDLVLPGQSETVLEKLRSLAGDASDVRKRAGTWLGTNP